jgi:hypothetical protein
VARHTIRKTASKLRNRDVYDTLHEGDFSADLEALIMQELGANTGGEDAGAYEEDAGAYGEDAGAYELAEVSDETDSDSYSE